MHFEERLKSLATRVSHFPEFRPNEAVAFEAMMGCVSIQFFGAGSVKGVNGCSRGSYKGSTARQPKPRSAPSPPPPDLDKVQIILGGREAARGDSPVISRGMLFVLIQSGLRSAIAPTLRGRAARAHGLGRRSLPADARS
eukprot:6199551-Pleurochrysis_carterae.AAC.4